MDGLTYPSGPRYNQEPIEGIEVAVVPDDELQRVEGELYRLDPSGDVVASVIRDTFDQLYDGQHTGRYDFGALHKTEKTHMGTLVEINLHRAFGFADGDDTDYRIAGIQVDCKYSMKLGGWMLPPEVIGHLALLITADDRASRWSAGLVRVSEDRLRPSRNRDAKGALSPIGLDRIHWLWPQHAGLTPNLFLQLDPASLRRIFDTRASRSHQHGQAKVDQLFRTVQRRIIRRSELATVAQQDDFMKRARGNGGSRTRLQPEGILVLGHQDNDPMVAQALGLPRPHKGEFVSARVVPADVALADQAVAGQALADQAVAGQALADQAVAGQALADQAVAGQALADQAVAGQALADQAVAGQAVALINGRPWRVALAADPVVPAPLLPRRPPGPADGETGGDSSDGDSSDGEISDGDPQDEDRQLSAF